MAYQQALATATGQELGIERRPVVPLVKKNRYRFYHTRKGVVEGIFLGKVKAPRDDPQDTEFWTVAMDTSDGSGCEWLRRASGAQATTSNLRPSLVEKYEVV